jgi:hypothetical protein
MERTVVVETDLNDQVDVVGGKVAGTYIRRARTRFVDRPKAPIPELPQVGDPWDSVTVRARLERMGETYRRLPGTGVVKPAQVKSCMPTPVREPWKDAAPLPLRQGVTDADLAASNIIIDVLTAKERGIAWAIANRTSNQDLAELLHVSSPTAGARKQAVLELLAAHWNTMSWRPDAEDILRAHRFLHRRFR